MKKTVKIEMYLAATDEWGNYSWTYVCTVWGDHIEFEGCRWYLRDADERMICCGNVSELHGDGSDDFYVKFKNAVCY